MAILIGCENLSLEYPTRHVFDGVTVGVAEGDRIGIVGRNGDGKSTLLRLLANELEPSGGSVTWRRGLTVGVLGQSDALDDNAMVGNQVVGDAPTHEWASDARTREIIHALIEDIPWEARVGDLSGGQRRRVDLARLLIGDWDVLMLDEPTNHLDVRAITWLSEHLRTRWSKGQGGLLVVTHDRWFLDEVCLNMWEVHDGVLDPFEGGYSAYILQRVERDRQAAVIEERRQNLARKELAWLSRGAQARSTKPKFRVEAARALIADVPPLRNELELKRLAVSRLGKQVIELKDASELLGDKLVLDHITWAIGPGDRYGIVGENGAGKSTLLRVMDGSLAPTTGSVKIGATVKFAVLSQRLDELMAHAGETVLQVLGQCKSRYVIDGKEVTPSQLLERLGFDARQKLTRVEELSGGQKRRLQLMLILLSEPNVLILDEPGNDMDTDMLAIMEDLLDSWPGTLILVSHDRYLMERVTDHQFALMDGKIRHLPGGVDEFLKLVEERDKTRGAAVSAGMPGAAGESAPAPAAAASGLTRQEEYQLKKQLASVERKLDSARKKVEEAKAGLLTIAGADFVALGKQQEKVDAAQEVVDELEMEWLELSEKLEA
ncbi:MAG: ABC-F family ATP-binding cassette domain-containing protein [Coriobacteriia bacterium]|nr:ABC-F family ATP-binding cassette domain-containing protein [Coriobacteriia bacterium]